MNFLLFLFSSIYHVSAQSSDSVEDIWVKEDCEWMVERDACENPHVATNCMKSCGSVLQDQHVNCSFWAQEGYCESNPHYMLLDCAKSCAKAPKNKPPQDRNENCEMWAKRGDCVSNPQYMFTECKKTCFESFEDERKMEDKHPECQSWAEAKQCDANPRYMLKYCKKSCDKVSKKPTLQDTNAWCRFFAERGDCKSSKNYMLKSCSKSCHNIDTGLRDDYADCKKWAKRGECQTNASFMSDHCTKSCKDAPEENDVDDQKHCAKWAQTGHCTSKFTLYMKSNCRKSCNALRNNADSKSKVEDASDADSKSKVEDASACTDLDPTDCPKLGQYCESDNKEYKKWMDINCKKTCSICSPSRADSRPIEKDGKAVPLHWSKALFSSPHASAFVLDTVSSVLEIMLALKNKHQSVMDFCETNITSWWTE